jgi:hypothetical protein
MERLILHGILIIIRILCGDDSKVSIWEIKQFEKSCEELL